MRKFCRDHVSPGELPEPVQSAACQDVAERLFALACVIKSKLLRHVLQASVLSRKLPTILMPGLSQQASHCPSLDSRQAALRPLEHPNSLWWLSSAKATFSSGCGDAGSGRTQGAGPDHHAGLPAAA